MKYLLVLFLSACAAEKIPDIQYTYVGKIAEYGSEDYKLQCASSISDALSLEYENEDLRNEIKRLQNELGR